MIIPTIADDGAVPTYAHDGDAGADLRAAHDIVLSPGERALAGTGVAVAIPAGHVGLVTPRSGLAARFGLSIVNAPGVIDSGYRGEIQVCLINLDPEREIRLSAGDRIAQLLIMPVVTARFVSVEGLDDTVRGDGGYGSTGGFAAPTTSEGLAQ